MASLQASLLKSWQVACKVAGSSTFSRAFLQAANGVSASSTLASLRAACEKAGHVACKLAPCTRALMLRFPTYRCLHLL